MIMRVLCPVAGARSQARAMLPVARAIVQAGHEVLVVAPSSLLPVFDGERVQLREGLLDLVHNAPVLTQECHQNLPRDIGRIAFESAGALILMTGPHLNENYRTLLPVARDFKPDLVVRDGFELTGCLVAEAMEIPHVPLPSGGALSLDHVKIMSPLNERRRDVGLPTQDDPNAIYRYGRLDSVPPQYSFAQYPIPEPFSYCQPAVVDRTETFPPWLIELPAHRPLVMAAIGGAVVTTMKQLGPDTLAKGHPVMADFDPVGALRTIVTGLSQLDCLAVVATGGLPVNTELIGANVHVVHHFPQVTMLECAQLFITHGGYNSIRESIRAGVPMAVLPQFSDQFYNADRVQELGLGLRIRQAEPEQVVSICLKLLEAGTKISTEVRRAQRHMLALPPVGAVVTHLEKLVSQTR
jgi:UDP:flavonoid glycosyltransferase YjiC (YdhE family)